MTTTIQNMVAGRLIMPLLSYWCDQLSEAGTC